MNAKDRRVRKTKKALRDALASLMLKKELHCITVRELTDVADIHRATFYTHYQDVYDLYEQLEKSIMNEIDAIIVNDPTHSYKELYEAIIEHIYDNTILWKMLLGKNGNKNFQNSICNVFEEKYLSIWLFEDAKTEISDEMRYFATYHIQGCISLIELWINKGLPYSKETIIEFLRKLDENIERILP